MSNILIFAGTSEGRILTEEISRNVLPDKRFFVCVATEYGKELLPDSTDRMTVIAERLDPSKMADLMERESIDLVIDATHPYAEQVSANITNTAKTMGIRYIRLLRRESEINGDHVMVPDMKSASEYLKGSSGNVLLTIGSKELGAFTDIPGFKKRLYPRILPIPQMVDGAHELGFDAGHLICMQGPFTYEMNLAMIKQINAKYLVTKESGSAGGFDEKLKAASEAGTRVIIVGRPVKESGVSLEEAMEICGIKHDGGLKHEAQWFPMFMDIADKRVLVVGAGKIAARRIRTLSCFDVDMTIVAPQMSEEVMQLEGKATLIKRCFEETDLQGKDIVIAATNHRQVNRMIGQMCRTRGLTVNVADMKEECDFYFPGIVQAGDLTVGITAGGRNHSLVVKGKQLIKEALDKELAE